MASRPLEKQIMLVNLKALNAKTTIILRLFIYLKILTIKCIEFGS
jgi:hypothetical protein